MKIASLIARILLGLIFVVFGANFFFNFIHMPPPPPADSPAGHFMAATFTTGFLTVVHVLELIGGVLLLAGRFVNLGLVLVGPIVVNIVLFHLLIAGSGAGLPIGMAVLLLVAFAGQSGFAREVFAAK